VRPSEQLRALLLGSTVAIAVLFGFAGTAVAAPRCEAAPGTSGIDQYCETVPGANGDRGSGTGPGAGRSLDPKTVRSLDREGRDGRGVLALPSSGRGAPVERGSKPGAREGAKSRSKPSESTLGPLGSAIESGPSAGQSFLWVLAAAAVGMVGIAWARYRRGSKSEES